MFVRGGVWAMGAKDQKLRKCEGVQPLFSDWVPLLVVLWWGCEGFLLEWEIEMVFL